MNLTPRLLVLLAALAAVCAAGTAPRRDGNALKLLRSRALKQAASSYAQGSQSASAFASSGGGQAQTAQSAQGAGAQVQGISQVGSKVDVCQRGPANSAECQTLTTADRSSNCTDIPPAATDGGQTFTCAEQAKFGKCDSDFIFLGAFCLSSCNRCGSNCTDKAPSGGACSADQCESAAVKAGPYCLKTCGRCSTA